MIIDEATGKNCKRHGRRKTQVRRICERERMLKLKADAIMRAQRTCGRLHDEMIKAHDSGILE